MSLRLVAALLLLPLCACPNGEPKPSEDPLSPAGAPQAPTQVTASNGFLQYQRATSAFVSWQAPQDAGSSSITAYTVTVSPGGLTVTVTGAPPPTGAEVPGLTPGATYTFTVSATNGSGRGPESVPSAPLQFPAVPNAPQDVTVLPGSDYALVRWSQPPSSEGPGYCGRLSSLTCIRSYVVTAEPGGQAVTVPQALPPFGGSSQPASNMHAVVRGLDPAVAYRFTVHAVNEMGPGAASPPTAPVALQCTHLAGPQTLVPNFRIRDLAVGDLDADAWLDAVTLGETLLTVFLDAGAGGSVTPAFLHESSTLRSVVVADLGGSALADIAVLDGQQVKVFLNGGSGTFTQTCTAATGMVDSRGASLAAADLDGDGQVDLVTSGERHLRVLLNAGECSFRPAASYAMANFAGEPGQVALADLNGDAKLDVAVVDGAELSVFLNAGDGVLQPRAAVPWSPSLYSTEPAALRAGDLTGDGVADLLTGDVALTLFANQGDGTFAAGRTLPTDFLTVNQLALGDVDRDGSLDIAFGMLSVFTESTRTVGDLVGVVLNDGAGNFGAPTPFPAPMSPGPLALADLDDDGRLDLAVASASFGALDLLRACPR